MFLDGVDSDGKTTCQHIYEHSDSRKAYVGPGYCSDPDLEWILFLRNRQKKERNIRQNKRTKISLYIISIPWLIILPQAAFAIPAKGAWVLLSLWGYWSTKFGGVVFFNNFRDLIIRSSRFKTEKNFLYFLIVILFICCGNFLIYFGGFHYIFILFLKVPVLFLGLFMGIIEALLQRWKEDIL